MTIPAITLLLVFFASLAYTAWAFFIAIPRTQTSLYRYQLWRVRDAAMDKVLAGDKNSTLVLLAAEVMISEAAKINMELVLPVIVQVFWHRWCTGEWATNPKPQAVAVEPSPAFTPELQKLVELTVNRLFSATPIGWLVFVMGRLLFFIHPKWSLFQQFAKQIVLNADASRRPESLANCVG